MPRKLRRLLARALLPAALLGTSGAPSAHEHPVAESHVSLEMSPVRSTTDCSNSDVRLEPASDFSTMKCSSGQTGFGQGYSIFSEIVGEEAMSRIVVIYQHAGTHSYLKHASSRALLEELLDGNINDSMSPATTAGGYEVSRFVGKPESTKVSCFAFARYAGHVDRTTDYQDRVFGFYCEDMASDQPVSDARIEEVTGKIKTSIF